MIKRLWDKLMGNSSAHIPELKASGHLEPFLDVERLADSIDKAVKVLNKYDFDALAFRGMSGAIIAPPVALAMGKSLILVRKPTDESHSNYEVEGDKAAKSYVIIDDFISSGTTAREIMREVESFAPRAKCLGVLEVQCIHDAKLAQFAGRQYPLIQMTQDRRAIDNRGT